MRDAQDDDLVLLVVNPIQQAVRTASCRPDPSKIVPELLADPLRVLDQGRRQKVNHGYRDRFRQFARDGALSRWRDDQLVRLLGTQPRSPRTASTPRTTSPRA